VVKCEEMRVRFVETIHICSRADNKMGEIKKKKKRCIIYVKQEKYTCILLLVNVSIKDNIAL